MLRYNFWPLSLMNVKTAFTLQLMETLRTIQLEKGMSTSSFCQALKFRYEFTPGHCEKVTHVQIVAW